MSRFVSAGAIDATTGNSVDTTTTATTTTTLAPTSSSSDPKSSEWASVTAQLEADRKRRQEARLAAASGEKSLYEVLQANKAAKQAAFEEANKLKNQFRALDEDEIDFLDEVRAKKREEEAKMKKEVEEGLEKFKRARKEVGEDDGDGRGEGGDQEEQEQDWGVSFEVNTGRKRVKRGGDGDGNADGGRRRGAKRVRGLVGVRRKESSGDGEGKGGDKVEEKQVEEGKQVLEYKATATTTATATATPTGSTSPAKAPRAVVETKKPLGGLLVDYGSDDDD